MSWTWLAGGAGTGRNKHLKVQNHVSCVAWEDTMLHVQGSEAAVGGCRCPDHDNKQQSATIELVGGAGAGNKERKAASHCICCMSLEYPSMGMNLISQSGHGASVRKRESGSSETVRWRKVAGWDGPGIIDFLRAQVAAGARAPLRRD